MIDIVKPRLSSEVSPHSGCAFLLKMKVLKVLLVIVKVWSIKVKVDRIQDVEM